MPLIMSSEGGSIVATPHPAERVYEYMERTGCSWAQAKRAVLELATFKKKVDPHPAHDKAGTRKRRPDGLPQSETVDSFKKKKSKRIRDAGDQIDRLAKRILEANGDETDPMDPDFSLAKYQKAVKRVLDGDPDLAAAYHNGGDVGEIEGTGSGDGEEDDDEDDLGPDLDADGIRPEGISHNPEIVPRSDADDPSGSFHPPDEDDNDLGDELATIGRGHPRHEEGEDDISGVRLKRRKRKLAPGRGESNDEPTDEELSRSHRLAAERNYNQLMAEREVEMICDDVDARIQESREARYQQRREDPEWRAGLKEYEDDRNVVRQSDPSKLGTFGQICTQWPCFCSGQHFNPKNV